MGDLLWGNPETNRFTVWLMAGTEPFERGPDIPGPGRGWFAAYGADFDHDGMADVFWYNPTKNRIAVWLMGGIEVRVRGPEIQAAPSTDWLLAAAGDFNRDLMTDSLWFDPKTKRFMTSLMFGTEILERTPEIEGPPGSDWIVGQASDCNGDGLWDVVRLGTRPLRMSVWLMSDGVPFEHGPEIPGPAGAPDAGP